MHGQLIASSAYGLTAGAAIHSSQFYAHLDMAPSATVEIPTDFLESAEYVASGAVEPEGVGYAAGKMLVLGADASRIRAVEHSTVMLFGGEPT